MKRQQVALVKCSHYDRLEVEEAVKKSLNLLGGIERFVSKGSSVLVKPNLLTDAVPESCIDTHPEVVRAVIHCLKDVAGKIYCGDSPTVWGKPKDIQSVYEVSGLNDVCREEGVEMVSFTTPKMRQGYLLTDWLDKCGHFVSVPKFKTHGLTVLTGAVKNLFGLVVGMYKMKLHRDFPRPLDFASVLVDIFEAARPDLTVLDGVWALEGEGPGSGGIKKQMNLIAASPDALALDTVLASIMGILPSDIATNAQGYKRGLGSSDLNEIDILGENPKEFSKSKFKLPSTSYLSVLPSWVVSILKLLLKTKPEILISRCKGCGICLKSCPVGAIKEKEGRFVIDYAKCISCLCCQEFCPHAAIQVKKSLILRLRGV